MSIPPDSHRYPSHGCLARVITSSTSVFDPSHPNGPIRPRCRRFSHTRHERYRFAGKTLKIRPRRSAIPCTTASARRMGIRTSPVQPLSRLKLAQSSRSTMEGSLSYPAGGYGQNGSKLATGMRGHGRTAFGQFTNGGCPLSAAGSRPPVGTRRREGAESICCDRRAIAKEEYL